MERFEKYVKLIDDLKRDNDNADIIQTYGKLKLYGLYKQSTVGNVNTPQPSVFNFVERSKWNAWNEYAGIIPSVAMTMYVDTVKAIMKNVRLSC